MKTLLLTLVVVTILCLDLGNTLKCYYTGIGKVYMTCPKEQNICYYGRIKKLFQYRGCAKKCPEGPGYVCCNTDYCNK
uniref:Three-finger toxin n=1 Tax=Calliophis bivirgatus TaxID=8633 RepID=A0A898IN63_CALBG|nr:three-finger toxin [Calliophis bivirgatus]